MGGGQVGVNWGSFSRHGLSLLCFISVLIFLNCMSFFLSFFLSGQARRGQGELPRAAGGLFEVSADGEQERTVYNIVMI